MTNPELKPAPDAWEAAYLRFETPEQEIRKFARRLQRLGAGDWPRDARIVELFCGRGNGIRALRALGFARVEGIDLSPALVARYEGPGTLLVGDCRHLPFESETKDILIVQGGLHHLPTLPADLEAALREARRVLAPGGLFCAVEPWHTPFLAFVHHICANRLARTLSSKVNALATMIEHERETYEQWLDQPQPILNLLHQFFEREHCEVSWGKINFVGRKSA
jgi:SAM-dependent methyltransferase